MKRVLSLMIIVSTASTNACRREAVAVDHVAAASVTAKKVATGVQLTNHTDRGVAYAISNPNWLGLLSMCNDPGPACVRLAAGESVVVPFADIHGFDSAEPIARVAWWHVGPDGPGHFKTEDETRFDVVL